MDIAPPDRLKRLSRDESSEVTSAMLVFYVHLVGVLDAFSIALVRQLKPEFPEKNADLLSKKFREKFTIDGLNQLFVENDAWLTQVKEEMRNRFVHRIPPYMSHPRCALYTSGV